MKREIWDDRTTLKYNDEILEFENSTQEMFGNGLLTETVHSLCSRVRCPGYSTKLTIKGTDSFRLTDNYGISLYIERNAAGDLEVGLEINRRVCHGSVFSMAKCSEGTYWEDMKLALANYFDMFCTLMMYEYYRRRACEFDKILM